MNRVSNKHTHAYIKTVKVNERIINKVKRLNKPVCPEARTTHVSLT